MRSARDYSRRRTSGPDCHPGLDWSFKVPRVDLRRQPVDLSVVAGETVRTGTFGPGESQDSEDLRTDVGLTPPRTVLIALVAGASGQETQEE